MIEPLLRLVVEKDLVVAEIRLAIKDPANIRTVYDKLEENRWCRNLPIQGGKNDKRP